MKNVRNRLLIGIDNGSDDLRFYSNDHTLLATGYVRVVIGKRGPYVEFHRNQIQWDSFIVPEKERYRWLSDVAYYVEHRSKDGANVMMYYQKRTVAYADYKVGFCYIAPSDLLRGEFQPVFL